MAKRKESSKTKANGPGGALVIVESPSKARTIERYLGKDYRVLASMGHVRDLPDGELGIDLERNFHPTYQILPDKKKTMRELEKASQQAEQVYLATDLDREGEAIAWHLVTALKLEPERTHRVVFNEITKDAIQRAFAAPRDLDLSKVDAQQARRLLDRIVGYQLSPLLWKKIAKGLSAGRVQSVAVRLIVEREQEIRGFVPEESWSVLATFSVNVGRVGALAKGWSKLLEGGPQGAATAKDRARWLFEHQSLQAELAFFDGKPFDAKHAGEVQPIVEALGLTEIRIAEEIWPEYADKGLKRVTFSGLLDLAAAKRSRVQDLQVKRTTTKPSAPFITATLQQAASTKLGFSPSRTMRIAQQLYEGVELGGSQGAVGLITYMRTDSRILSKESVEQIRELVRSEYGDRYLPEKPQVYGSGARAQEAHEAIRPTLAARKPEEVKEHLKPEQFKLYDLIWRQTTACQMTPAEWDSTSVSVAVDTPKGEALFKANGRRLVFDGFYAVTGIPSQEEGLLPELKTQQPLALFALDPKQQYTSPPPRYTEAGLIKKLEAEGIGRPSTYAAIIQTIQDRGYAELLDRRFYATDKGQVVTEKLIEHFPEVMDVKFTSHMETELDQIESEKHDWTQVLREFYTPFSRSLQKADAEMEPARSEPSAYTCPKCGKEMVYRWSKRGRFLSCTGYPECTGAYNVDRDGKPVISQAETVQCEKCGKDMQLRRSRLGPFLGCTGYPECDQTVPCDEAGRPLQIVSAEELERPCEECGQGTLKVKKRGRREFLACDAYPKCKATASIPEGVALERKSAAVEPAGFNCDKCDRPMLIREGARGKFFACSGFPSCRNTKPHEKLEMFLAAVERGELKATTDEQMEALKNGRKGGKGSRTAAAKVPKTADGKVDVKALGPPPPGFAWTRTGKPVVETWPEEPLTCPMCGKGEMTLKRGRYGPFYSCGQFPQCRTSINLRGEAKKRAEEELPAPQRAQPIPTDVACAECGSTMLLREGRTGKFLGCGAYPKCKATQPIPPGASIEDLVSSSAGTA